MTPLTPQQKAKRDAEKLAASIFNRIMVDYGKETARFYGQDTSCMTDEKALAWAEIGKNMKWPYECSQCGQSTKNILD